MTATCRPGSRLLLSSLVLGVVAAALLSSLSLARAQVFGPPSTFYGSVTDAAGPIDAGLTVEAWVGNTLCGSKGKTEFVGEGSARVTVYSVDAVSKEQTPGCGAEGVDVRIKIGDRFAPNTGKWKAGPVQLDVTFGNATPAAIPTFTPTPVRTAAAAATPQPSNGTPVPAAGNSGNSGSGQGEASGAGSVSTVPAGSPGAGSPAATLSGGLVTSGPGESASTAGASSSGDGGFPVWAGVVIALVAIAVVGGGVGYGMSRSRRNASSGEAADRA